MRHITFILLGVALSLTSLRAWAQEPVTDDVYTRAHDIVEEDYITEAPKPIRWKHNIRIGLSTPGLLSERFLRGPEGSTNESLIPSASHDLASMRYYRTPTYYFSGLTAEYNQNIKPWLAIGGKATFAAMWSSVRHVATDELLYRDNNYSIGVIFNIRFEWLRRDIVQMYSGIGIGLAARIAFNDGILSPMFDATYVGISLGRSLYGFAEVGTGISGMIRAGMGYRF